MKKIILILMTGIILISCKEKNQNKKAISDKDLTQEISNLIDSLYTVDQDIQLKISSAAQNGENEKLKELFPKEKAIFKRHIPILKDIYKKIGYPTIELVGKENSTKFFTLVQHSDSDVDFQKEMLQEISREVKKGNVSGKNYAFLTDRVQIALQNTQVYGTQLDYNMKTGQAYPKKLIDSSKVNERRKEIGLTTLEEYLNKGTEMHFQMNKNGYLKDLGISEPKLYKIE
jgi:hypothetical protein